MADLLDLGFDRYQRFKHAAVLIDELAAGEPLTILEAGSWDQAFAPFAPQHKITAHGELITPDSPLAHPGNAFDLCLALDVLEHVPPDGRRFFIAELNRVARRAVVLGFPIADAAQAEGFVLELTGSPWLKEHQEHGLPDPGEVEAIFGELGLEFERHPNAALPSWMAMMLLMYGTQPPLRERISRFFNRRYYELENREPAYRYIYVLKARGQGL